MSRSDSDIDLDKYTPSIEASLRLADHAAAEERLRKAFDNPDLRAMLAAEGRSVDFTPVPPDPAVLGAPVVQAPPPAVPIAAPEARISAPSPWAKEAPSAQGVDAAVLSSANTPTAEPVTSKPATSKLVPVAARPATQRPATWWTPTRKGLAAVVGAFAPVIVTLLLLKPDTVVQYVPMPMSAAPATPARDASEEPSPTHTANASASASTTTQPSARPATSAVAPKPRPRPTSDDPYDAAPVSTATVTPTATPSAAPSATTSGPVPWFP